MLRLAAGNPHGSRARRHVFQATTVGSYGPVYGAVFAVLTVAAIAGLIARYRKVGVA